MTLAIVDALVEADLFRLYTPADLGGHEADVDTIIDVCEELAFADGSVGWSFAQNTSVLAYSAYLAPEFARPLAAARAAAGMFAPLGTAARKEGGFEVSGNYKFGSGSGHAEFMGGAAMVMVDGEMAPFIDGLPEIRGFIVPSDRVEFKGNWDVMGLCGTGSVDFDVPLQFVEDGRTFLLFEPPVITGGAIFGLGPIVLGTISSTAWAIGVARRALHEVAELARSGRIRLGSLPLREQPTFQRDFGRHATALRAARLLARDAYRAAVAAWANGARGTELMVHLRETRAAATYTAQIAKAAASFAWEASGSAGMRNPSLLQRCFRDLCIGVGHQVFDERNFVEVAKPALGVEPEIF